MLNKLNSSRLELIDSLRGITLISMIVYHFIWDMVHLYGYRWKWFYDAEIWQQSICWTFIIISGFSWSLGKHHLKRGLIVFAYGIAVSVITFIITPSTRIIFGILTLIGSSMLIMIPLSCLFKKFPASIGAVISFTFFILTKNLNKGYLGFAAFKLELPELLYRNYVTAFFGFPQSSFYSSDYFSLFPWFFLFLFGYFVFHLFESRNLNQKLFSKGRLPLVSFLGRHSLAVYLLHQPIIYGICEAIKYI